MVNSYQKKGPILKLGASLEALAPRFIDASNTQSALEGLLTGLLTSMKQLQIETLELPLDAAIIYPSLFTEEAIVKMAEVFHQHGITISIHLPFMWCDPASLDENIRVASVNSIIQLARLAQPLEAFSYVLHLTGERAGVIGTSEMEAKEKAFFFSAIARQAGRSLEELCQELDPAKLCVENLIGFPFELLLEGIRENKAQICFDIGHYILQGEDPNLFLAANLSSVRVIHLHDVAPIKRDGVAALTDHQPLGSGIVKGKRIISMLRRRRFNGLVIIEVNNPDFLTRSLVSLAARK